jgi:hypothetical protein
VDPGSVVGPDIAARLESLTEELRKSERLLLSGAELPPRILADFRAAVNRVRNAAWALQQYAETKETERDPDTLLSVLAGERLRVAYQLCEVIRADLINPHIALQKGSLLQLQQAMLQLLEVLGGAVGK